jgi:TnpA family transposase
MPRRSLLTAAERESLLALPDSRDELIRRYTLNESDLAVIRQHRGAANRLGFAVALCYMRYPGLVLPPKAQPSPVLLGFVAAQLKVPVEVWAEYGERAQTRREHLAELEQVFGFELFSAGYRTLALRELTETALETDKGVVLATALIEMLRLRAILLPRLNVIERVCAEAVTRANRRIYKLLSGALTPVHRIRLNGLLQHKEDSNLTWLGWLRQPPSKPTSRSVLEHIERLQKLRELDLPPGIERQIHQNRLLKIAREGGQMTPADLMKFEPERRYATLVALAVEATATITDEIIDLHDRIVGKLFNTARHRHQEQFQAAGKAINDKLLIYGQVGQALLNARGCGCDPFAAIEAVMPWDRFAQSVAEAQKLAEPEDFDFLYRIGENYPTVRRYAPEFLDSLHFEAAPAAEPVLEAIELLRELNAANARKLPEAVPVEFIRKRWDKLVFTVDGIDRRFYELCALAELKNALRSGDIWVKGSRQFRNFDEYLITPERFQALHRGNSLALAVATDCEVYLHDRLALLNKELAQVDRMALANQLPEAILTDSGLKITPLDAAVPSGAQSLIETVASSMPHVKITELLQEVDSWTGFTRHFTHLKTGGAARDRAPLLTTILADAINLGLTKMAESCPGASYAKLAWLQAWHIRDETYASALAELVNAQLAQPFARHWGDGTTSSSDGQRFRAGGKAESTGHINPKYGGDPGKLFYTHVSDQYTPFSSKVVNVGVRDSTYVLDGLLHHESDLRIEEHYTDTAGFTDHVFALMHLLGFRFAPRLRDLADTRLYVPDRKASYRALTPMLGGALNLKAIRTHWTEILRLAASIKYGTVSASLMLRKLGSYPRQNGLAVALRELGRIERTLFLLSWLQSAELRRRVHAGLNKGEARNALARAVFFCRQGEIRDRSFEQQRYRASGLALVTAAIALWNTVYIERAINASTHNGQLVDPDLFRYLSPLGWEHINLTGDYQWRPHKLPQGKFRPLRTPNGP